VFQAYWRARTSPSPVHRRPARPTTDAALRLLSAVCMASVMSRAVSDDWASPSRSTASLARSFEAAAEKKPNTAMPSTSRGSSDRKPDSVMARASSRPWSSL